MLEKLSPILLARSIPETEAFWHRLGFVTIYIDPEYLLMKREGAEIHFVLQADLDPYKSNQMAYLRPSDVNALDAEWAALGLPATGIPRLERATDKPWRMRELALLDLNGNLIRAGQELPLG
jgi:hypothetical protein